MKELNLTTESDERTASMLMAVTFTLTGEFYDWVHTTTDDNRKRLMATHPRPGDLFMRVLGPWAIELVASFGVNVNDKAIAEIFAKEFEDRIFNLKKGGIGTELGTPGVQQGLPPTPQTVTEDAAG